MDDFGTPVSSGSNMSSIARFPKLDECAHFHYEHVELGTLEVGTINSCEIRAVDLVKRHR